MNINVVLMLRARATSFKSIDPNAQYSSGKTSAQVKRMTVILITTQRQLLDSALKAGGWYNGERRDRVTTYFDIAVKAINGEAITGTQLIAARIESAKATNESMGYSMSSHNDEQIQKPFDVIDAFVAEALSKKLIKKLPKPKPKAPEPA